MRLLGVAFVERTTPRYREIVRGQRARLAVLQAKTLERERAGEDTACSNQILAEIDWLMGDAIDFKGVASRLSDLEALAAHPAEEAKARRQDPEDGGWGQCHGVWFFKVNATFDHITNPAHAGERPRYSLRLFDRVNSTERLTRYFDSRYRPTRGLPLADDRPLGPASPAVNGLPSHGDKSQCP